MTSNNAPSAGRTTWHVLLVIALLVAGASIVLIALDPQKTPMYFTLVGMLCLVWVSVANLRRLS